MDSYVTVGQLITSRVTANDIAVNGALGGRSPRHLNGVHGVSGNPVVGNRGIAVLNGNAQAIPRGVLV
jgi:hypothetical protein